MDHGMAIDIRSVLTRQFDIAWALTGYHLQNLSTAECLWRPAAAGPHIHQDAEGRWRADWPEHEGYDLGPASIGWLTWHLGFWWSMVIDHCYGEGTLTKELVHWPGGADEVRSSINGLQEEWRRRLDELTEDDLLSTARTRWPLENRPFVDIVAWVNVELMKNAAEIGYARFLYAVAQR
ncbi:MAG: DinB family protein [Polyangiaceae bacterium]|nr:DinB family protein [Polyangiaceae bacterium]